MVHVESHQQPHGAHDGDPRGVKVREGMQEERHDDAAEMAAMRSVCGGGSTKVELEWEEEDR